MNKRIVALKDRLAFLLMAIPFVCVGWGAIAWLQYGIDFPWYDDWRGYQNGNIQSLELSYLFKPINDTLSPVGLALDALFQRMANGNTIVYQLVSMIVVLIGLLMLQLSMLRRIFANQRHVVFCFLFALPMLQPGSYWGAQNLAYHQALPLLFFMLAIWIVFFEDLGNGVKIVLLSTLGILGGFSYVSGALAFLTGGFSLLVLSIWFKGAARKRIFVCSVPVFISGLVASSVQLTHAIDNFGSTHSDIAIAYPTHLNFWMYLLGKVGRALLFPVNHPLAALMVTLIAVLAVLLLAVFVFRKLASAGRHGNDEWRAELIFLTLLTVLGAYLLIVAAGRTNYYSKEGDLSLAAFIAGFDRFHFFWLTLLWPWTVAVVIRNNKQVSHIIEGRWFYGVSIVCLCVMSVGNLWQHGSWHKMALQIRKPVYDCFVKSLTSGKGIHCERLLPYAENDGIADATPAYIHALKINASFLRYIPRIHDLPRSSEVAPFYEIDARKNELRYEDLEKNEDESFVVTGNFPKIFFEGLPAASLKKCVRVDVLFQIIAETDQYFQLFFQRYGDPGYREMLSKKVMLDSFKKSVRSAEFKLIDVNGFAPEMRLDLPAKLDRFKINGIRFYCVFGNHEPS